LNTNTATSDISGYAAGELLGKTAFFLRPEVRRNAPYAGIVRQITLYVCGQQDLHEKESLEMQLDQAQKMEALGTQVGGIAHDFNNMLGGITSSLFLARNMAGDNHALLEKLKRADALCFRSADMIKQLLAFARKDHVAMKVLALNSFIKEAMKLHASAIPESIRIELRACSEQAVVCADATRMQQMLLNLLNNACHAVRQTDKPRINISTLVLEPDGILLSTHPEAVAGLHIGLSVADNGAVSRNNIGIASSSHSSPPGRSAKAQDSVSRPSTALSNAIEASSLSRAMWAKAARCRSTFPFLRITPASRVRCSATPWTSNGARGKRCCLLTMSPALSMRTARH